MKRIFVFIIFCLTIKFALAKDSDTLSISIDLDKYVVVAKEKLHDIYLSEAQTPSNRFNFYTRWCSEDRLKVISIPVFEFNEKAKTYQCGEPIEHLVDFTEDPYFQVYIPLDSCNKMLRIGNAWSFGEVLDSYILKRKKLDSLRYSDDHLLWNAIYGSPLFYGKEQSEKNILKYKEKNPDAFVFMIAGLYDYWSIRKGQMYKLVGRSETDANNHFRTYYGEEYIHDTANYAFKIGYPYIVGCSLSATNIKHNIHFVVKINSSTMH